VGCFVANFEAFTAAMFQVEVFWFEGGGSMDV
jgi:hypothetical protein